MRHTTISSLILVIFLLFFAFSSSALAHKVRIFAWQEGEQIITESKFSGGRPAINATVMVVNPLNGETLLSGSTDQSGQFSFPLPGDQQAQIKELDIIIDGGDGHKNHWLYAIEEESVAIAEITTTPIPQEPTSKGNGEKITAPPEQLPPISREELRQLLETTIDKKLSPIKRTLAENAEKGPSLQDILGGIGYIFGLAGIAAYMNAKKMQAKNK